MPDGPLLTVAIPTYNGARHLAEALRSVLAQGEVSFELLVCDDRSEDDTVEIIHTLAGDRARVEINSERLGLAGNWNHCVALCQTPWVAIFHQDDIMRQGHLAAHLQSIASDQRLGLICSASTVIDSRGLLLPPNLVPPGMLGEEDHIYPPGAFVVELATGNPVRCSGVTTSVAAHQAVGGFDPSYRYVLDWDFWLRVAREWSVAWLSEPTVQVRWHPESETHRFKSGTVDLDEIVRLQAELYARDRKLLPDPRKLRRIANRKLARAFLNRAHEALHGGDAALARRCLRRSLSLWPGILAHILIDTRLAAQVAAMVVAPRAASRWLARRRAGSARSVSGDGNGGNGKTG